jgi:hypothetical protein
MDAPTADARYSTKRKFGHLLQRMVPAPLWRLVVGQYQSKHFSWSNRLFYKRL